MGLGGAQDDARDPVADNGRRLSLSPPKRAKGLDAMNYAPRYQ